MNLLANLTWLDYRISEKIASCHTPWADRLFSWITALGDPWFIVIIALSVSIAGMLYKNYGAILLLLFSLAASSSSMTLFKNLIQRARPEIKTLIEAAGYSFPSGHATVSLAFYGTLAYILAKKIKPEHKKPVYCLTGSLIFGIGFSRIYWNVHYLSDVICGFGLGAFWLWISIRWIAPHLKF